MNGKISGFLKVAFVSLFMAGIWSVYAEAVPRGYGGVTLGMGLDETKGALKKNSDFGYAGDRDVSLLPGDDRILIETDATLTNAHPFLTQCWFQFYEEKLYVMIINMNPEKVDHYSVYSSLCQKYGEPAEFTPDRSVWKGDGVIMSLERPLSLKYIDSTVSEKLRQGATVKKSASEYTRDVFLKGL